MGYYRDESGKRRAIYDRDPRRLYEKIKAKEKPKTKTFAAVADEWAQIQTERVERGELRQTTFKNYKPLCARLTAEYGDYDIKDINADHVRAALNQAKGFGYSRTVVNSVRVVFNGILQVAVNNKYIATNPAESVALPPKLPKGKRRAPTEEEASIILSHKETPFELYIYMLLCTGLRRAEGLALHKSDIDLDERFIHVRRSLVYPHDSTPTVSTPKTESSVRDVYIADILLDPLRDYMKTVRGDILFPRRLQNGAVREDKYFTATEISRLWDEYRHKYELPGDLTIHCLRHGTATILFEAGVDVLTTAEMLGHSNTRTTMEIYEELRSSQRRRSLSKYNRALSNQGKS